jgi:hypothetical protein
VPCVVRRRLLICRHVGMSRSHCSSVCSFADCRVDENADR